MVSVHRKVIDNECVKHVVDLAICCSAAVVQIEMKAKRNLHMSRTKFTASILALGFALCASTPSFAIFGDGINDNATPPKAGAPKNKSPKAAKCTRGETVKRVKLAGKYKYSCVKLKADVSTDADLYQQARLLADEGEYEWALDHLRFIHDQQNPEVLNYTGYANRKSGRLETGIAYYQQALALNPNYVEAREYLGEAYVLSGFDDRAQQQLQEIEVRSGVNSKAYVALKTFIREAKTY
jgi:tetratricopeptide (TPR) repeat protein